MNWSTRTGKLGIFARSIIYWSLRTFVPALAAVPVTHGIAAIGGFDHGDKPFIFYLVLVLVTALISWSWLLGELSVGVDPQGLLAVPLVAAGAAAITLAAMSIEPDTSFSSISTWKGILAYAAINTIIVAPIASLVETILQRHRQRQVQHKREAAEHYLSAAAEQSGLEKPDTEAIRAAQYERASEEAEVEVRAHLPLNPRSAKRVLNHLRLALLIATARGVFNDPKVQRKHLAKWVLLGEQWPTLSTALIAEPTAMDQLEAAADLSSLQDALAEMGVASTVQASDELLELLHNEVRIAPVLGQLIRL